MRVEAQDDRRSREETELVARLIVAAHESTERRLSQTEVDSILGVTPAAGSLAGPRV